MSQLAWLLLASVVSITIWGIMTECLMQHRGSVEGQRLTVYVGLIVAVAFKVTSFMATYSIASNLLARTLGSERMAGDPLLDVFFAGSHLHVSNLVAGISVAVTFVSLGRLVDALQNLMGEVSIGATSFPTGARVGVWGLLSAISLYFDTSLLMFSAASAAWGQQPAHMPDLSTVLQHHAGAPDAWVVHGIGLLCPACILLAALMYGRARARLQRFAQALARERALGAGAA